MSNIIEECRKGNMNACKILTENGFKPCLFSKNLIGTEQLVACVGNIDAITTLNRPRTLAFKFDFLSFSL